MATVKTFSGEFKFIECYGGRNIVSDDNGVIMVHDPNKDTVFIVCMDDSKSCGRRTFDEKYNNAEAAKGYIDWLNR